MAINELLSGEYEIWRNAQWRVTNMVLEEIADPTLAGPPYWIALSSLRDADTLRHVCEKTWVDPVKFIEAYRFAAQIAGFEPDLVAIDRALNPPADALTNTIRKLMRGGRNAS